MRKSMSASSNPSEPGVLTMMIKRRTLLVSAVGATLTANAQVLDLQDAINKAGRQRMLSQRISKSYLAMVQGVEVESARSILDKSMALFDRQLVELRAFAPNPDIRDSYNKLDVAWGEFKLALIGAAPSKGAAPNVVALDSKVLVLAHQGTVQYEAALGKSTGHLINLAGRQRMLSQRMAKFYLAAGLGISSSASMTELNSSRADFLSAMKTLKEAPESSTRIKDELQLAEMQWVFFEKAIQRLSPGQVAARASADVFVTSENLLSVMDKVTGMYSALKA
jgi:hypothetical protein